CLATAISQRSLSARQQCARLAQIPSPRRQTVFRIPQCPKDQRHDRRHGCLRLRFTCGCPLRSHATCKPTPIESSSRRRSTLKKSNKNVFCTLSKPILRGKKTNGTPL